MGQRDDSAAASPDPLAPLLARIAARDRDAFRSLYTAAAPKLMGVLMRMLRDRADAEDALQEVFTRIWLKADSFEAGRAAGMSWIIAIARNHAIDRLRARPAARRMAAASGDGAEDPGDPVAALPAAGPGPEGELSLRHEMQRVVACFGELDADRAAALRGAYLDGLSYEELSARFAVPLNTMRTWLRRGLIRLRECLER